MTFPTASNRWGRVSCHPYPLAVTAVGKLTIKAFRDQRNATEGDPYSVTLQAGKLIHAH